MPKYQASLSLITEGQTRNEAMSHMLKQIGDIRDGDYRITFSKLSVDTKEDDRALILKLMDRFGITEDTAEYVVDRGDIESLPDPTKSVVQVLDLGNNEICEYSTFDDVFNDIISGNIENDDEVYIIYADGSVRNLDWVRTKAEDRIKELFPALGYKFVSTIAKGIIENSTALNEFFSADYCYAFFGDGIVREINGRDQKEIEIEIHDRIEDYEDLLAIYIPKKGVLKYNPITFTKTDEVDLAKSK